jgi:hypothetical protein
MFHDGDTFRLAKPLPGEAIPVGTVGVVLMVFDDPSVAYEVEFPDGRGGNLGTALTFTVTEDYLDPADGRGQPRR